MYDAILILGGSYIDQHTLPEWVHNRLNAGIQRMKNTRYLITLSRGTPHKLPALDKKGFPVDECTIMANYLVKKGVPKSKILKESWSFDTIGNAYAALLHHAIPKNLRNFLIITSDFHMPRTKSIFKKVFSLYPLDIFKLEFLETESKISISEKEKQSLKNWEERSKNIHTLCDMHDFIHQEHNAYNVEENDYIFKSDDDKKMYCI